jgi:hypothetical protein
MLALSVMLAGDDDSGRNYVLKRFRILKDTDRAPFA